MYRIEDERGQNLSRMTAAERLELGKLVRLNAKVAKDDAAARGQWLLADAETKLAARYKADEEAWADITAAAEKAVEEADAAIAALCRARGIPEDFRPGLHLSWYGRGENASRERRAELRKVAQAQVAALVKEAQVEIDRVAAQQLTQITQAGLTSEEARAFISGMPKPEELLPPLATLQLGDGQLIALEAPLPVPAVTPEREPVAASVTGTPAVTADVTDNPAVTPSVTASRNVCAFCGEAFTPSRRDGKYCRPACRVADYRRRLKVTDGR
jgi:hypothetical protein